MQGWRSHCPLTLRLDCIRNGEGVFIASSVHWVHVDRDAVLKVCELSITQIEGKGTNKCATATIGDYDIHGVLNQH